MEKQAQNHQCRDVALLLLTRPLAWGSVALLLLNDHLLKGWAPGWLTGKLSDFAGIVVLGAVLLVLLASLADRLRCGHRWLFGLVAALVTAFWVPLKTWPAANAAITRAAEGLLGHVTWYVVDPTDLAALLMLLPLGLVWRRCVHCEPREHSRRLARALPVLAVAGLALVATSPRYCFGRTDLLYSQDEYIYAIDLGEAEGYSVQYVVKSRDGGRTWESAGFEELPESALEPPDTPVSVCSGQHVGLCYRTAGHDLVEVSYDGGESWQVAWRVPPGRDLIMQRVKAMSLPGLATIWRTFSSGPFDMEIVSWAGHEVLVVAVGSEGVLSHPLPDGVWERNRIQCAEPTPYREANVWRALLLVMPEITISLVSALLAGHLARWLGDMMAWEGSRRHKWGRFFLGWSAWPHLVLIVVYGLAVALAIQWSISYAISTRTPWLLGITDAVLLLTYALAAAITIRREPDFAVHLRSDADVRVAWLTALLVFFSAALPWYLWSSGVIWAHGTALVLSLSAGAVTAALACLLAWRAGAGRRDAVRAITPREGED